MRAALVFASTLVFASSALACRTQADIGQTVGNRMVQVSVNFNTSRPASELRDPGDSEQSPSSPATAARRSLYFLVTKECDVLLATIASSCQLANISVSSREYSNPPHQGPMVDATVSATLAIELKRN